VALPTYRRNAFGLDPWMPVRNHKLASTVEEGREKLGPHAKDGVPVIVKRGLVRIIMREEFQKQKKGKKVIRPGTPAPQKEAVTKDVEWVRAFNILTHSLVKADVLVRPTNAKKLKLTPTGKKKENAYMVGAKRVETLRLIERYDEIVGDLAIFLAKAEGTP